MFFKAGIVDCVSLSHVHSQSQRVVSVKHKGWRCDQKLPFEGILYNEVEVKLQVFTCWMMVDDCAMLFR